MKIFLDSADLDEIKQFYSWGIADGVTTNPSLMKKAVEKRQKKGEMIDLQRYITAILAIAKGTPVSLEVTETTTQGMIRQGIALYEKFNPLTKNVVIKIPINPAFRGDDTTHFDGIAAIKALHQQHIPVNCTLVFTPEQALVAAKAGATFISPFAGRVDDHLRSTAGLAYGKSDYYPALGKVVHDDQGKSRMLNDNGIVSGIDLVRQCVQILEKQKLQAEVLAASLRNARQVREAALVGAHIATLPLDVVQQLLQHQKTYEGMALFTKDIVPEYEELASE